MARMSKNCDNRQPRRKTMDEFFAIIISAAVVDNIVLAKMLGLCPFISLSKRLSLAVGVGVVTTFILTAAVMMIYAVEVLIGGVAGLQPLRPLVFIALIAVAVQAVEILMRVFLPLLHRSLGVFLPLVATNCAVLGVVLLALRDYPASFASAAAFGLGGGLGFLLAIVCAAAINMRIVETQVPTLIRGAPLAMMSAGIMALAFAGLAT